MTRFIFFFVTTFLFSINAQASWLQDTMQQTAGVTDVINSAIQPLELQAAATMAANGLNTNYGFLAANYTPNANIITIIQQVSNGETYSDAFKITLTSTSSVPTVLQGKVLTFTAISGQSLQSPSDVQWSCTGNINDGVFQLNPTSVPMSFLMKDSTATQTINFLSNTPLASCKFS